MKEKTVIAHRLDAGEMSICTTVSCKAYAVYKVSSPKTGLGARGGAVTTRYLCGRCLDKYKEHLAVRK